MTELMVAHGEHISEPYIQDCRRLHLSCRSKAPRYIGFIPAGSCWSSDYIVENDEVSRNNCVQLTLIAQTLQSVAMKCGFASQMVEDGFSISSNGKGMERNGHVMIQSLILAKSV